MFANAIYSTAGEGRCGSGDPSGLGALRHAMSARYGGRQGEGGAAGRGGPGGGGRGRHRHRGFGHGPEGGFGGFPFGGGPGGGPRGRGRKARRGDIRTAALLLLAEEPRNGYQIMQEVQERSDGVWRPSPGSVYPALAQLEDEGLIRSQELDGRKLFALTDEGRALIEQRDAEKPAPWEQMSGEVSDVAHELGKLMREVAFAFSQVMRTGGAAQMAAARGVLDTARRDLYRILADGEPQAGESAGEQAGESTGKDAEGEQA
jgi:DNA-binding PadR family transcriptional regulator